MNELVAWLSECRRVFPKLKRYTITCEYAKTPKNCLGRAKGVVHVKKDIDAEALLLDGEAKVRIKRRTLREYTIEVNKDLRKIRKKALRKQVAQTIIIHELLHIEEKDLTTLAKDHRRRKKKRIHVKEFRDRVLERYNHLRRLNNLPEIKKREDLELAVGKIISEHGFM